MYIVSSLFSRVHLEPKDYFTLTLSTSAFILSLVSAFRNDIFPLILKVLAGDIILLPSDSETVNDLIIPITFINNGYADGFIETIFIMVTRNKTKKLYLPLNELDSEAINNIVNCLPLKGLNIPFSGFQVPSKQTVKKYIWLGFNNKDSEFTEWRKGKYRFELYVKSSRRKKLRKISEFEHELDDETIISLNQQKHFYIRRLLEPSINKQIKTLKST